MTERSDWAEAATRRRVLAAIGGVGAVSTLPTGGHGRADATQAGAARTDVWQTDSAQVSGGQTAQIKWEYTVDSWALDRESFVAAPTVVGDRVIVSTTTGDIRVLDRETGEEIEDLKLDGNVRTAPVFDEERVFFANENSNIVAIDRETSEFLWESPQPRERDVGIAVTRLATAGDTLISAHETNMLYALDAETGAVNWERQIGYFTNAPLVVGDQVIAASGSLPLVRSYDLTTGAENWRMDTYWQVESDNQRGSLPTFFTTPTIANGLIVAADVHGTVYGIDAHAATGEGGTRDGDSDGESEGDLEQSRLDERVGVTPGIELAWISETDGNFRGAAITGTEERAVLHGRDGGVYAIDAATGEGAWEHQQGVGAIGSAGGPTVTDTAVITTGINGITAMDRSSGEVIWDGLAGPGSGERVGASFTAAPIVVDGIAYVVGGTGGRDAVVTAIETGGESDSIDTRAVTGALNQFTTETGGIRLSEYTGAQSGSDGVVDGDVVGPGFGVGAAVAGTAAAVIQRLRRSPEQRQ